MLIVSSGAHASPTARVLGQVRRGGVVMREDLVETTGLSAATVARAVTSLADARLVRLRPDMGRAGTTGRPSIPLQLETRCHAVIGIHVGRVRTTIALLDLRGRVLESTESPTPSSVDDASTGRLLEGVVAWLTGDRVIISVAMVSAWTDLGLDRDDLAARLGARLGLTVATTDHITAAAAAEHAVGSRGPGSVTAYVYARDTIGYAVVEDCPLGTVISRATRLTHFPSGSQVPCHCRALGCLEATASDLAIGRRAVAEGLVDVPDVEALRAAAGAGSVRAGEVLGERAAVLGRAAAVVRDMVGCDRLVLVGQGFTSLPELRDEVARSFEQATTLPPVEIAYGHHGTDLQAVAAGTVALVPLDEDPIAVVSAASEAVPVP